MLVIVIVLLIILIILYLRFGLNIDVGKLGVYAKDIRDNYRSFELLLRVPAERGSFGELSLETILSDRFPPELYGIRKKVLDGKYPDAHIKIKDGIICIDSKFPLDNYNKMINSTNITKKEQFKNKFLKNVREHLEKIANDYICPDKGSAEFAFMYIPSESVYYFLISEGFSLLKQFADKSVQVVSPLTLAHKVTLIKKGILTHKLSEEAIEIKNDIISLSRRFKEIDKEWGIFYNTHFTNFSNKANTIDIKYKKLRDEFSRISLFLDDDL